MTLREDYPKCLTCGHRRIGVATQPRVYCSNDDKLCDDDGRSKGTDALKYQYTEGGLFIPGDNFGCIHHTDLDLDEEGDENA